MSNPSAEALVEDFKTNGANSTLGQLFIRLVVLRPIEHLYSDQDVESIKIRFTDGKTVSVDPKDVGRLSEAPDQRLEDRFVEGLTSESAG